MSKQLRIIGLALSTALVTLVSAQGKYGATPEDSIQCITNLSLYQEFVKQGSYQDAYGPWSEVLKYCPSASKGVYQNAPALLGNLYNAEKDPIRKLRLRDSLFLAHDLRIQYFGEECFVLGMKGVYMMQYDPDNCQAALDVLTQAKLVCGARMQPGAIQAYYSALYCVFAEGKVTKEQMMVDYVELMGYIDPKLSRTDLKELDREDYTAARNYVNGIFFKIAECEDIGRIVGDMLARNPEDQDMKVRLLRVLNGKDCTEEKVYRTLAEDVHRANPSSESAYSLGMYLVKRNELNGAAKYLKEAADLCDGCADKVRYLLKAGQVASATGNHGTARSYANQILQIEPKNGEALILIGDAVSSQAGSCDKPDNWGVYWSAYDYYQRAKSLDASVSEKAGDRMVRTSAHFPTQSEAFFYQLTDGQAVQVGCGGLNESTTVRTRK